MRREGGGLTECETEFIVTQVGISLHVMETDIPPGLGLTIMALSTGILEWQLHIKTQGPPVAMCGWFDCAVLSLYCKDFPWNRMACGVVCGQGKRRNKQGKVLLRPCLSTDRKQTINK